MASVWVINPFSSYHFQTATGPVVSTLENVNNKNVQFTTDVSLSVALGCYMLLVGTQRQYISMGIKSFSAPL